MIDHERFLFEEFKARGDPLSDDSGFNDVAWYLLMQHHGAPTRLLDWTDGALIALHFATITRGDCPLAQTPCVYILDPDWLDDETPDLQISEHEEEDEEWEIERYLPTSENIDEKIIPPHPMNIRPEHFTRRTAAQRSEFILFGTDARWLRERANEPRSRLRSILIDGSRAGEIQSQLRTCGITESVIFPDLDGLGREMMDLWRRLQTE